MKRMLGYLIAILIIYASLLVLLRIFENRMIFYPNIPGRLSGDWHPRGMPVEDVWLRTSDSVKLHAWWIAAPDAAFTFVNFHGNAANIANRADIYLVLRSVPANVLAVEYRGYGKSEGKPDEQGIYLDAQAAYEFLVKERGIAPGRIISIGQSLGTAVATDLASTREVAALVLEAPFASTASIARRVFPFLPGAGRVAKSKFETGKKLASLHVPVLVFHCKDDPVIPFAAGEEVFQMAREPKTFVPISGFCHEEAALLAPDVYLAKLREFLAALPTK
ncbi:MAG: alpha/beta hydrolase [Acidobacteria bacterium]|nr:alpha/beta hydrolase [Acidobacteriota bacterium]MCL5289199.1 alpha/beta hydrolase [Acidobacteriota bacterium]